MAVGFPGVSGALDYDDILARIEPARIQEVEEETSGGARKFFKALLAKAEAGEVDAQYQLGICLRHGCHELAGKFQGFPLIEYGEAAWWFTKAAQAGHVDAHYELAHEGFPFPETGRRVSERDGKREIELVPIEKIGKKERLELLQFAADHGNGRADDEIWRIRKQDEDDAIRSSAADERQARLAELEEQFAETGDPQVLYEIGMIYRNGYKFQISTGSTYIGQGKNELAAGYFKKAVKMGHGPSVLQLGILYEQGWGVEEDLQEAIRLYVIAEEMGVSGATGRISRVERKINAPIERQKELLLLATVVAALLENAGSSSGSTGQNANEEKFYKAMQEREDQLYRDTIDAYLTLNPY